EAALSNHKSVLQTGTTRSREVAARIGVTNDEAENPPRLLSECDSGKAAKAPKPPVKRRVKTHTASAQDSSTPVPWRWRSRAARIRGGIARSSWEALSPRGPLCTVVTLDP